MNPYTTMSDSELMAARWTYELDTIPADLRAEIARRNAERTTKWAERDARNRKPVGIPAAQILANGIHNY